MSGVLSTISTYFFGPEEPKKAPEPQSFTPAQLAYARYERAVRVEKPLYFQEFQENFCEKIEVFPSVAPKLQQIEGYVSYSAPPQAQYAVISEQYPEIDEDDFDSVAELPEIVGENYVPVPIEAWLHEDATFEAVNQFLGPEMLADLDAYSLQHTRPQDQTAGVRTRLLALHNPIHLYTVRQIYTSYAIHLPPPDFEPSYITTLHQIFCRYYYREPIWLTSLVHHKQLDQKAALYGDLALKAIARQVAMDLNVAKPTMLENFLASNKLFASLALKFSLRVHSGLRLQEPNKTDADIFEIASGHLLLLYPETHNDFYQFYRSLSLAILPVLDLLATPGPLNETLTRVTGFKHPKRQARPKYWEIPNDFEHRQFEYGVFSGRKSANLYFK